MDNNNWLQQILMLGIGTTSLVADRVREVSEQWVKEGKINPDQAKILLDNEYKAADKSSAQVVVRWREVKNPT